MKPATLSTLHALWAYLLDATNRHLRTLIALVLVPLALATGGAFAVVTWVPDGTQKPVQWITESVSLTSLSEASPALASSSALSVTSLPLYRSTVTRSTDTLAALLSRLGVNDPLAVQFFKQDTTALRALLAPGHIVKAQTDTNRQLAGLSILWLSDQAGQFNRLRLERQAQGFHTTLTKEALTPVNRLASGVIQSSLFAATDDAAIPDAIAVQIAEIFSGEIDFHRDLRKGDQFSVVYQVLLADGEVMKTGKVVATDFVNNGQTLRALWFDNGVSGTGEESAGGYFTPEGNSLKKEFLASPLAFSRITSGFAMRLHPISKLWKAHLGVDYGAPTGTPVRTIGAGTVAFAGVQGGFGNVVFIDHGKNQTTVYAHLSKISVRKGERVQQGQNIGAVGATGWATGPHLHFEFRVGGQHVDPLVVVRKAQRQPLNAALRPAFNAQSKDLSALLGAAKTLTPASAQ